MSFSIYQGPYNNIKKESQTWECEIFDAQASAPTLLDMKFTPGGVTLSHEGDTRSLLPGVYPTTATFGLIVENAQQENLINNIRTNVETRYIIKLKRDGVLFFTGFVISDLIEAENISLPYEFQISAVDGLSRLQGIDYNNNGTAYSGKESIHDHIVNCLGKTGITDEYPNEFFTVAINWYEQNHANTTDNPLTNTRVDHKVWTRKNGKEFTRTWDVLNDICKVFNMRLYYANGKYHFEQLNVRKDATFRRFIYNTSGTLLSTNNSVSLEKAYDNDIYPIEAVSTHTYLSPLREVLVRFEYNVSNLAAGFSWDWQDETLKSIGSFKKVSDTTKLRLSGIVDTDTNSPTYGADEITTGWETVQGFRHEFEVTIKCTRQSDSLVFWMYRTSIVYAIDGIFQIGINADFEPLDDPANDDIDLFGPVYIFPPNGNLVQAFDFSLTCPPFGSVDDVFDVEVAFDLVHVWDWELNELIGAPGGYSFKWWVNSPKLEILEGEGAGAATQTVQIDYYAQNDTANSDTIEVNVAFGDAPNKQNGLEVYDGTSWIPSEGWQVGAVGGTGVDIGQLLATQLMQLRKESRMIMSGGFIGYDLTAEDRYYINWFNGKYFLFVNGEHVTGHDVFRGELIEIAESDTTGVTNTNIEVDEDLPYFPTVEDSPDSPFNTPGVEIAPGFVTDEEITTSGPYTTINIVNDLGATASSGDWITITNLATGETEIVQLSADLDAIDTSISIVSYTFTNGFPDGSPLGITQVTEFEWVTETFKPTVSSADLTVTGPIADPTLYSSADSYNNWVKVTRAGARLVYKASATLIDEFDATAATNKIVAPTNLPFRVGERVMVEYKKPK